MVVCEHLQKRNPPKESSPPHKWFLMDSLADCVQNTDMASANKHEKHPLHHKVMAFFANDNKCFPNQGIRIYITVVHPYFKECLNAQFAP